MGTAASAVQSSAARPTTPDSGAALNNYNLIITINLWKVYASTGMRRSTSPNRRTHGVTFEQASAAFLSAPGGHRRQPRRSRRATYRRRGRLEFFSLRRLRFLTPTHHPYLKRTRLPIPWGQSPPLAGPEGGTTRSPAHSRSDVCVRLKFTLYNQLLRSLLQRQVRVRHLTPYDCT